jgi:hypothetical protein
MNIRQPVTPTLHQYNLTDTVTMTVIREASLTLFECSTLNYAYGLNGSSLKYIKK